MDKNKSIKIICNFAPPPKNMKMRERVVKYMKWLLPMIFIAYYGSITLFIHVHIENGTTIVHSHPFGKVKGGANHHHDSLSEIQLFHILTTISVEEGAVHAFHLDFHAKQIGEIVEIPVYPDYLAPVKGKLSLRAPPVF